MLKNWTKYIEKIVDQYNETPLKRLGGLKPNDITSEFDSVLVTENLEKNNVKPYKQPHYKEQQRNQRNFDQFNRINFKVGDRVYRTWKQSAFDKSYDTQVFKFLLIVTR